MSPEDSMLLRTASFLREPEELRRKLPPEGSKKPQALTTSLIPNQPYVRQGKSLDCPGCPRNIVKKSPLILFVSDFLAIGSFSL
jgi:hypothetical protein